MSIGRVGGGERGVTQDCLCYYNQSISPASAGARQVVDGYENLIIDLSHYY